MKLRSSHFVASMLMFVALILTSCGSEKFRIEGSVSGMNRASLRAIYHSNGNIHSFTAVAGDEGKFLIEGNAVEPTMVEIFTTDRKLLARVVVKNGDEINCELDRSNPYKSKVEGNEVSEQWAGFLNQNAELLIKGDSKAINDLVAKQVNEKPKELLSALLLVTQYDAKINPAEAQKFYALIDETLLPVGAGSGYKDLLSVAVVDEKKTKVKALKLYSSADSMATYRFDKSPLTLLAFSTAKTGRSDSIVAALKELSEKYVSAKLSILDVSVDPDTVQWKLAVDDEKASWKQAWAPGSLSSQATISLAVSRVPYFIVADSTGKQLYRGDALSAAKKMINSKIK